MNQDNEIINIEKCPVCGKPHKYGVAVVRSSFMFSDIDPNAPQEKRMRRLFSCPKTGTDFEGIVVLKDDLENKIVSVKVEVLVEEDE